MSSRSANAASSPDQSSSETYAAFVNLLEEVQLWGWRQYNHDTCQTVGYGSWSIQQAPAHGTYRIGYSTGVGNQLGGTCSGTYQYLTIYYTWADTNQANTADTMDATWTAPDGIYHQYHFVFTRTLPKIEIFSGDIALANNISFKVTGAGAYANSGKVTFALIALGGATYSQDANGGATYTGGPSTTVSWSNRPTIPENVYWKLKGDWQTQYGTATTTYSFGGYQMVLGIINHTQYNTPSETSCSTGNATGWIFNSSCQFTQVTLRQKFMDQVYVNGTGNSQNYGVLKYNSGSTCGLSKYPVGATTHNAFLQVPSVRGSCNVVMQPTYQALYPPPQIPGNFPHCGSKTVIVDNNNQNKGAQRLAEDYCPACANGHHIDNYSASTSCSPAGVGSLGNFWTVRTP